MPMPISSISFQGLIFKLIFYLFTICIFIIFTSKAHSEPIFERVVNVRALGMGGAYSAVVSDIQSLFFNPAGLARNSNIQFLVMDPHVNAGGLDAVQKAQKLSSNDNFKESVQDLYGENVSLGASARTGIAIPFFAAAIYNSLNASVDVENPVYPALNANVVNDFGYVLGAGFPVFPLVHLGFAARRVKRKGANIPIGASLIADLDTKQILQEIEREGSGYGLDTGLNFVLPGPITAVVALVWKDVGQTSFTPGLGIKAPPIQEQEMSLGAAVAVNLPFITISPSVEFKHLNRQEIQLAKKIHLGAEISLPLVDLRAGLHQGYYTLGAGVDLGVIRVDAASYGVEMGEYPGQREDRRYAIQMTFELAFDTAFNFTGGKGKGSSAQSSGSSARRLKQRR